MATNPFAEYKWLALLKDWRVFAEGLSVTLEVAIVALLISLALGILAIPRGQSEAGLSQGFTYFQTMRYIILPQAKRIILPNIANQSVSLIKNTSVLAMIAGGDLMYRADSWSGMNMYYGPTYLVTGVLYWLMCFPLTKYIKHLEKTAGVKS